MSAVLISGTCWEDSGCSLLAYVQDKSGDITQSGTTSIALTVTDITDPDNPSTVTTATPSVSSTIFDTPRTDHRWTIGGVGYNFEYNTSVAQMPTGASTYRFEFLVTPASGSAYHVVFEVDAKAIYRS